MKQRWTSNLFMLSCLLLLVFLRASKFKLLFSLYLAIFSFLLSTADRSRTNQQTEFVVSSLYINLRLCSFLIKVDSYRKLLSEF